MKLTVLQVCVVSLLLSEAVNVSFVGAEDRLTVLRSETDSDGVITHHVTSPWQQGETLIRVLKPARTQRRGKLKILFVLPVEAGSSTYWGDGLHEIRRHALHEKHGLICVAPTFSKLPWFADHPTELKARQESYLVKGIVPFIDRTYLPEAVRDDRLLVGFSKSGWGAFSLILRHPDLFEKAAAWDAPLMMERSGKYGSGPIFGTQENFEHYRLTDLIRKQAEEFTGAPRLIHTCFGNFRSEHVRFEALLNEVEIAHVYENGPERKHHWSSGWLPEAVHLLMQSPGSNPTTGAVDGS